MTITPTASPELPDLDRLQRIADEIDEAGLFTASGELRETIHNLRRAQPEGEAPQAERDAARYRYIATLMDWRDIEKMCWSSTSNSAAQFKHDLDKYIDAKLGSVGPEQARVMREVSMDIGLTRYSMWSNATAHGMDASPAGQWVSFDELQEFLTAQQAAAPGALTLLNADELAALHRFQETCQDFDSGGYDVDKNMMKRLASIGVIESKGFNRYQFTEFGDYVVENQAPSAPGTPEAPKWHAPGMGEVHSQDHVLMIHCSREIDDPDIDYVADNELAKRVCDALNAAQLDGGQGEGKAHG